MPKTSQLSSDRQVPPRRIAERGSPAVDAPLPGLRLDLLPLQGMVFNCPSRFRVLVAGRRFGKTQLALVELIWTAFDAPGALAWYVAPTTRQAKQIAWDRLKSMLCGQHVHCSETELSIRFQNGGVIALRGADNYDGLRGSGLDLVVLDEFAGMKPQVWSEVLRPALADRKGRALFIGTPQGRNHFHDLYERAQSQPNWSAFQFTTKDGGIVTPEELASAAACYDERLYAQEFEASFENTAIGRAYHAFDRNLHVRPCRHSHGGRIIWALDFNVTPMCSVIAQRSGDTVEVLDEIVMQDGNTWRACEKFWHRVQSYRHHYGALAIDVYGDASGHQRRTSSSGTDWTLIRDFFSQLRGQAAPNIRAAESNPAVRDRVNIVNTRLRVANSETRLFIDPKCKELILDFERVCWSAGELEKSDRARTHLSDALGYYLAQAFPMSSKNGPRPERLL